MKSKPQVRLYPDLHKKAKILVGYEGNKSVEEVVNTALAYYLEVKRKELKAINASLIKKIEKESKR